MALPLLITLDTKLHTNGMASLHASRQHWQGLFPLSWGLFPRLLRLPTKTVDNAV